MTPEQFSTSLPFKILSERESEFVLAMIEGKSVETATRCAYPRARNQRVLCWQMRTNRRVLDALALWFGASPIPVATAKDEAISGLKKDIRKLKGTARVAAKKLLFELQGLIP